MKRVFVAATLTSLSLTVGAIVVLAATYLCMQQYLRLHTNELPQRYAGEVKARIAAGASAAEAIHGLEQVDMQKSGSPFVIIYDGSGHVQAGTGILNGSCPAPPWGVFNTVNKKGEDRITWQPGRGVRDAIIVEPYRYNGNVGFILSGCSLKETEDKQHLIREQIVRGMIFAPALIFVLNFIFHFGRAFIRFLLK